MVRKLLVASASLILVLGVARARAQSVSVDGLVESTAGGFAFPDGSVQQSAALEPSNILVVAKSNAAFSSIQAAIDSIGDASAANPYLVYIAPGVYSERVVMKPHVHLRGASARGVVIASAAAGTGAPTLETAESAELRSVTVESAAAPGFDSVAVGCQGEGTLRDVFLSAAADGASGVFRAIGVWALPCLELAVENVEITSSGGSNTNECVSFGAFPGSPLGSLTVLRSKCTVQGGTSGNNAVGIGAHGLITIADTTISVEDGGNANTGFHLLFRADSVARLRGVEISVGPASIGSGLGVLATSYGSDTGSILLENVSISSPDTSVRTDDGVSVFVGASRLGGAVDTSSGGSISCAASYSGDFEALDDACLVPPP